MFQATRQVLFQGGPQAPVLRAKLKSQRLSCRNQFRLSTDQYCAVLPQLAFCENQPALYQRQKLYRNRKHRKKLRLQKELQTASAQEKKLSGKICFSCYHKKNGSSDTKLQN